MEPRRLETGPVLTDEISGPPRTQAQACHKAGEHNRYHRRSHAKLRHGQAKPDQFIQNAAEPRNKEETEIPLPTNRRTRIWFHALCARRRVQNFESARYGLSAHRYSFNFARRESR